MTTNPTILITFACILIISFSTPVWSQDHHTIWVEPGQSVDVYWEINLSGTIYLAADIDSASACLDYWWITLPFGRVESLGRHCGRVSFNLPGISSFAIGGKLRAGGAHMRTRIQATSDEKVAINFPTITF